MLLPVSSASAGPAPLQLSLEFKRSMLLGVKSARQCIVSLSHFLSETVLIHLIYMRKKMLLSFSVFSTLTLYSESAGRFCLWGNAQFR